MGKGDKKTKRGKIVIGSSGVKRTRKKNLSASGARQKTEPVAAAKEAEELASAAAKTAAKKAAKKSEEQVEGAEEKAKAAKAKKKAAEGDAEVVPAQEEPKKD